MGQGRRILSLARCNLGDGREMANADPRGPSAGMSGMRARGGKRLIDLRFLLGRGAVSVRHDPRSSRHGVGDPGIGRTT